MAKRLRSLASLLWDTDSTTGTCEEDPCGNHTTQELQLENAKLRERANALEQDVSILRDQLATCMIVKCDASALDEEVCAGHPWVHQLRPDVLRLPRLRSEILPMLTETQNLDGKIVFHLPKCPRATASQVLKHSEERIAQLSCKHPAVFKIGIATNPVKRWSHPTYGYCREVRERWQTMKIVAVTACSFSAALIESALIQKFKGRPGCRNENPGGESASPGEGPHFTYVVVRVLVPPPRVTCARAAQIHLL